MIEIFEGRLGGGKTYSAVVRIVDHLRRGGIVATNVELKWDAVRDYVASMWELELEDDQLLRLTDEQVGEFHRHTPSGTVELPVLVVIDEAHLNFNSRDWAQSSRELLAFLTQSRKVATDIIFISQSALNVDKQFARLIQYVWRFRDLSKWKIPGLGIPYPFPQILACQFDYDGKTMLNRAFHLKDKRIFKLYETNSLLREFPRLQGVKTKRDLKKKQKERKAMAKWLLPLGLVVGIICLYLLKQRVSDFGKPPAVSAPAASSVSPAGAHLPFSASRDQAMYEVYEEEFIGFWNDSRERALHTSGGWYTVGEMSGKGFVTAVSDRRARIATPQGKTAWVVAKFERAAPVQPEDVPAAAPAAGVIAEHTSPVLHPEPIGAGPSPAPTPTPTPSPYRGQVRGIPLDKLGNLPRRVN